MGLNKKEKRKRSFTQLLEVICASAAQKLLKIALQQSTSIYTH